MNAPESAEAGESGERTAAVWLPRVAMVETLTVLILFTNRAATQIESVASLIGPLHGTAYLSTIACAWGAGLPKRARWLAAVPIIGGLLALATARSTSATQHGAPNRSMLAAAAKPDPQIDDKHEPHVHDPDVDTPNGPLRSTPSRSVHIESDIESSPSAPPAIAADGLVHEYSSGVRVGPLSFAVPRAAVTGLIGPNGTGKTTTIRMLLGLVAPHAGGVSVLGADWRDLPRVLDRVGALVEGPALLPGLSGRDNLRILTSLAGWPDSLADEALETVGLTGRARRPVREYSLGMRQRLALAGALLARPDLLILDEPANGLDPQGAAQLRDLLRSLSDDGMAIVVSSHVLGEVEQICDHLVVLADRGVVYHGPPAPLLARLDDGLLVRAADPSEQIRLQALLHRRGCHTEPLPTGGLMVRIPDHTRDSTMLPTIERDSHDPHESDDAGGTLNRWAIEAGIVLSRIEPRRATLEEVFFDLTGRPGATGDQVSIPLGVHPSATRGDKTRDSSAAPQYPVTEPDPSSGAVNDPSNDPSDGFSDGRSDAPGAWRPSKPAGPDASPADGTAGSSPLLRPVSGGMRPKRTRPESGPR